MMKWKVVKNPRSSSADRSLECLKSDVQPQKPPNDTNNNVGEDSKQDTSPPSKETNKQRDSSLVRKPSIVATECINLKSILGLSRQRSETNLSCLGLISTEHRRSRSEVRGVSCDRLTVGYHTTPTKPLENGKTRSSSPPLKSGCWLRGRKRERESRNPVKNNLDAFGKTIVTGSNSKRTGSKTRNGDCRTIVDGCHGKQGKGCPPKPAVEQRKSKSSKRSGEDDIIEEEVIYHEIGHDDARGKLLAGNKETFKDPVKVIRKKGMAPKPQIPTTLFKETDKDVNVCPNGRNLSGSPNSLIEMSHVPANRKPPRKNQTYNGRNQKSDYRAMQSVKLNNLRNNEKDFVRTKNNINAQSVIAVAEVHKETAPLNGANKIASEHESTKNIDADIENKLPPRNEETLQDHHETEGVKEELPPYHIDTPDYSTLDSVNCCSLSMDDATYSKDDAVNCNTDCDESIHDSCALGAFENAKTVREVSLSSILRDSTNETKGSDSEPKKTVRFEKLDLIEKYKRSKTESLMDTEEDTDVSVCESKPLLKNILDVNCNEIIPSDTQSLLEEFSQCSDKHDNEALSETNGTSDMTVNVLVRNQSPASDPQLHVHPLQTQTEFQNAEFQTQFVVKKSFVITVAKQEKGFKSLCANKKPEVPPEPTKNDQQISVTFLCSGPPSESWVQPNQDDPLRLRSISVPPRSLQPPEVVTALTAIRGRSRERRSKERQHCKKNHKTKKKETVFVMPQAVIDELSQVLEKRKPSLDEIPVHP